MTQLVLGTNWTSCPWVDPPNGQNLEFEGLPTVGRLH